ncbi:MAG: hypothetical protein AAFY06_13870 [Pseudomonadota bacterium]
MATLAARYAEGEHEQVWHEIAFPANRVDPIVRAGIGLPFTNCLRRIFERGGDNKISLGEVEPGIWSPEHPIFEELAPMMEPF